jgi:4-alpha-glucanotransferase
MQIDEYGIRDEYHDAFGDLHTTSAATRAAIVAAMELDADAPRPRARVLHPGDDGSPIAEPGELTLEDGTLLRVERDLPPDLPLGYHRLRRLAGRGEAAAPVELVIVAPEACALPADLRGWGWAIQLYSARSQRSWGMGDLGDLAGLAAWSRALGANLALINPLCAVAPTPEQVPSPYSPSSRRFRNPLYIRVEEVPGAEGDAAIEELARAGRALNAGARIDRDAVFALKMRALEHLHPKSADDPLFVRFCAELGDALEEFALFCAIAEREGGDFRRWPAELRRPSASGARRCLAEHASRVRFHRWLQWVLDAQLARASRELRVVHDLPIGVDAGGADAWAWQGVLANGIEVGAPADPFNAEGQRWGLPPFIPIKLRAAGYRPFVETLRATLRHAGGLRIDHVMGLFRLFWIPAGQRAVDGAYVYYPTEELLAIVALESARAGAVIIGEDLGTVEPGVRERLAAARILSYRLAYFQDAPPEGYPELALGAVTTHDLPTLAGLWSGADLEAQRALGLSVREDDVRSMRRRVCELAQLADDATPRELIARVHDALGRASALIVAATLEDASAALERPNLPGTWRERPNWSLPLPLSLEQLAEAELPRTIARALSRRHSGGA